MTKRNPEQTSWPHAQNWDTPLYGLRRIRGAARKDRRQRFTSLLHHITPGLLKESFFKLKKDVAAGVDKVTWRDYAGELAPRLADLHKRIHRGTYRCQPSKRTYVEKEDGSQRPIGIMALEDKIAQKAVGTILEQIYEVDFLGFSYGFRPGRKQHDALDAVSVGICRKRISYVLDADLKSFFDSIDHDWLLRFLEHRIADRRIMRLIKKWLRAGVSEEGEWSPTRVGTPQGAVISPLLANIFLHYVLDLWVEQWRKNYARGDVLCVRWADDFVMGFQYQWESKAFYRALQERLRKFNLALNENKTRIIEFGRFAEASRRKRGEGKPETFDFLGFTHISGKTRKNRKFTILRKPIARRLARKLKEIKQELMKRRHAPISKQGQWLRSVVQGLLNYYAVPGTSVVLSQFRKEVCKHWLRALRRRSHKARKLTWKRMNRYIETWMPKVRIIHPYPSQRLHVINLR